MTPENILPTKCCPPGSYDCQVPMPLAGRLQSIDFCIADIVAALNAANISTIASCCGHGSDGVITLQDGRELTIRKHTRFWENELPPPIPPKELIRRIRENEAKEESHE